MSDLILLRRNFARGLFLIFSLYYWVLFVWRGHIWLCLGLTFGRAWGTLWVPTIESGWQHARQVPYPLNSFYFLSLFFGLHLEVLRDYSRLCSQKLLPVVLWEPYGMLGLTGVNCTQDKHLTCCTITLAHPLFLSNFYMLFISPKTVWVL